MRNRTSLFCWTCVIALIVFGVLSDRASAILVQEEAGPFVATQNTSNTITDTNNTNGDWLDNLNNGSQAYFISYDWTINNNAGESGSGGFFGGLTFYDNTNERLLIGNSWNSLKYGVGAGGTFPDLDPADYSVGSTVNLVAKIEVNAGDDAWQVWLNPENADELTPDASNSSWNFGSISHLVHRAGDSAGQATLSNYKVATAWGDVVAVPEPSAFLFGGLVCSVLGMNQARKRRRS